MKTVTRIVVLLGLTLVLVTPSAQAEGPDEGGNVADVSHGDDVIVEGSVCASDADLCANGENFAAGIFNAEFLAKDTSQPGISFDDARAEVDPWGIGVTTGGGFGITDISFLQWPFEVLGNGLDNTLVVGTAGRVGVNTDSPVAELHVEGTAGSGTDTVLRLESAVAPQQIFRSGNSGAAWFFAIVT